MTQDILSLTEEDRTAIQAYKAANVLQPLEKHRIDGKSTILIACGDCDHCNDMFTYHTSAHCTARHHTLMLNGGALLLAEDSPLKRARSKAMELMDDLVGTFTLKNIPIVVPYAHVPCGKAREVGVGFEKTVELLMGAKKRIRESPLLDRIVTAAGATLEIRPFIHIFYGDRRKTYFVSRKDWETMTGKRQLAALAC